MNSQTFQPYLVAANLTRRCNLKCNHCYLDAGGKSQEENHELSTGEWTSLFSQIAERAEGTLIVLTGGEPLLRHDIQELVVSGNSSGLRMVLGTSGLGLTENIARSLKASGLQGVGISLDHVDPREHDRFRGVQGAWEKALSAVRACRDCGLHVQLHTTVTGKNADLVREMTEFAEAEGVSIHNFFFLVCTGRGQWMTDISPERYESVMQEIAQLQNSTSGMMIQARCAPHFKRVLHQNNPSSPYTLAQGYDGGGCPAATHYCRVDPFGNVTPCPYMDNTAGNLRDSSFWKIWDHAPLFQSFREPVLKGRCGSCEYQSLCGGCRARAQERHGDLFGEDPTCTWQPRSGSAVPVERPSTEVSEMVRWTPEARHRLQRIPLFLRGLIRKRLEEQARKEGITITPEFMALYRKTREEELGIQFQQRSIS